MFFILSSACGRKPHRENLEKREKAQRSPERGAPRLCLLQPWRKGQNYILTD